jgi:hypothetical protein
MKFAQASLMTKRLSDNDIVACTQQVRNIARLARIHWSSQGPSTYTKGQDLGKFIASLQKNLWKSSMRAGEVPSRSRTSYFARQVAHFRDGRRPSTSMGHDSVSGADRAVRVSDQDHESQADQQIPLFVGDRGRCAFRTRIMSGRCKWLAIAG